ncbi:MAG: extracellular solute-binding protein [Treponema sp.]|nr:extracellular solute-binding protein [Treponema sp.]
MKRFLVAGFMALAVMGVVFAGARRQQGSSSGAASAAGSYNDAPLESITPVAQLPANPVRIDPSQYRYDDLSKPVTIEFLTTHYGFPNSNPDPIAEYLGKKYNAKITMSTISGNDWETTISTRFAAGDYPDAIIIGGNNSLIQQLYDSGLVMDATLVMRYMPNLAQYFTGNYANYIRYKNVYPGAPRYPIQGDWGNFIRKDWLAKLNMQAPKTLDELLTYARRVTNEDPDGNGRKDSWFAGGAGNGRSFGMLGGLQAYFGDAQYNVKNGKINHMVLDGSQKAYLSFLKTLNDEGLLAPDWYTVEWEAFKAYSLNNRVGFVNYPLWELLQEQMTAMGLNKKPTDTSWDVWAPLAPLGSGNAQPASGPSNTFVFPSTLTNDPVKLKRVAHILDNSLYRGEDYYETIQGGGNKVFGKDVFFVQENPDGSSFFYVDHSTHPTWTGELDTTGLLNASWQNIGLAGPPYRLGYEMGNDHFNTTHAAYASEMAGHKRWPNNFLVQIDPAVAADLTEFERVEFPKFVFGTRSLNDWDRFIQEWLNAGGRKALTQAAGQMGVANFE